MVPRHRLNPHNSGDDWRVEYVTDHVVSFRIANESLLCKYKKTSQFCQYAKTLNEYSHLKKSQILLPVRRQTWLTLTIGNSPRFSCLNRSCDPICKRERAHLAIMLVEYPVETVGQTIAGHPLAVVRPPLGGHSSNLGNLSEVDLQPLVGIVVSRGPGARFPSASLVV